MAAIPIGGDPDDFAALRDMPPTQELLDDEPDCFHLSYVGTFLPRSGALCPHPVPRVRPPALDRACACRTYPTQFRWNEQSAQRHSTFRVRPIAEAEGVADVVREVPQRLPYLRALNWLARSRGLLLIGSDEPHYTASKIYPALMSGRPFVSLFHRASSAHAILAAAGGGRALSFATSEDLPALEVPLAEALRALAAEPESLGIADPEAYASYGAEAIACRFAQIFNQVAAEHAPTGASCMTVRSSKFASRSLHPTD